MDYELYHDESQISGYWHGMLLVPTLKKQALLDYLNKARTNTSYSHPLSLKNIRGRGRMYDCAGAWLTIGIASLMSKVRSKFPQPVYLGNHEFAVFKEVVGAKMILFRERDNLQKMQFVNEFGGKVEVTFRIGLKGGLHFLGLDDEYIHITKFHFDGNEHYHRGTGRGLSRERIIGKLYGLRDYCSVSNHPDIVDDRSSKHNKSDSQKYEDCQLLQLTDLLISSFRSILSSTVNPKHQRLIVPSRELIKRYLQGYARMQNSRWRNALWMSQCYLDNNGNWNYEPLTIEQEPRDVQLFLFDKPTDQ